MLSTIILLMVGLTVFFLVLAVQQDNAIFAVLTMIFGGIGTLFWGSGWESKVSEFVVKDASASTPENIGTWVTTTHNYSAVPASAWIPALLSLIGLFVLIYVVLKHFKEGGSSW